MPKVVNVTNKDIKRRTFDGRINHRGGDRRSSLMKLRKEQLYLLVAFMKDSQNMTFKEIADDFRIAQHPITRQRAHKLYQEAHEYFQTDPELHQQLKEEQ